MDWARRRQAAVMTVLIAAAIVLAAAIGFAVFYRVPTCFDHQQDGGETGVDCGGPCSAVCSAAVVAPVVEFARSLSPEPGRIDALAYVHNPNSNADVASVRGTFMFYDASGSLLGKADATFALPPSTSVPVFLPAVGYTDQHIAQTFFTVATSSLIWTRPTQSAVFPQATNIQITEGSAPRIQATLVNPTAEPINNLPVVVTVFDAAGNAVAASKTLVETLPPQGTSALVFTWNESWPRPEARVEIVPLIPAP